MVDRPARLPRFPIHFFSRYARRRLEVQRLPFRDRCRSFVYVDCPAGKYDATLSLLLFKQQIC